MTANLMISVRAARGNVQDDLDKIQHLTGGADDRMESLFKNWWPRHALREAINKLETDISYLSELEKQALEQSKKDSMFEGVFDHGKD